MNIVVIGGGLAGANAVEELRAQGYTEDITLLGAEPHPPYERPPLSKGVLLGNDEPDSVFVHDAQWYADQQVDLRTGSAVTSLDLDGRLSHDLEVKYGILDNLGPFTRFVYWVQNNLLRVEIRGDMSRPKIVLRGMLSVLQRSKSDRRDLPLPPFAPLSTRF